jgi:hypothetical protein
LAVQLHYKLSDVLSHDQWLAHFSATQESRVHFQAAVIPNELRAVGVLTQRRTFAEEIAFCAIYPCWKRIKLRKKRFMAAFASHVEQEQSSLYPIPQILFSFHNLNTIPDLG